MNLLRALVTVSGMTLLSRILGFVRDFVIARSFGAGMMTDAFFVAFRLPNLLRRLFAEGAFSQAFVPILAEYRARRGESETRSLVDRVASILFLILIIVSALGMAGMDGAPETRDNSAGECKVRRMARARRMASTSIWGWHGLT